MHYRVESVFLKSLYYRILPRVVHNEVYHFRICLVTDLERFNLAGVSLIGGCVLFFIQSLLVSLWGLCGEHKKMRRRLNYKLIASVTLIQGPDKSFYSFFLHYLQHKSCHKICFHSFVNCFTFVLVFFCL